MTVLPQIDLTAEAERISRQLRRTVTEGMRRRGLVVAMSGGIDSSVCAALAVRAMGRESVFGLLLPERDSSAASTRLARLLAEHLGIVYSIQDIASTLDVIGCYSAQDEVLRRAVPGFSAGWKFKLALGSAMGGRVNVTRVIAEDPDGERHETRLAARDYLQLVAATNFKQRVRKTLEYYHADRLNYAVVGTPNLLEYDQGFFVKNGDGAADVKPIAHLYKSEVYGMARQLGLPAEVISTTPTTDTFSLAQGQDEFYFSLPYAQMDIALWCFSREIPAEEMASHIGCTGEQARAIYEQIRAKRRVASYLHASPVIFRRNGD